MQNPLIALFVLVVAAVALVSLRHSLAALFGGIGGWIVAAYASTPCRACGEPTEHDDGLCANCWWDCLGD